MKDEAKTKEHLIGELAKLRRRIAELETSETEPKRAPETVKCVPEFCGDVLDKMSEAICIVDVHDFRIVRDNDAFMKQLGLKEGQVVGNRCYEAIHQRRSPCGGPDCICPLVRAVTSGKRAVADHVHHGPDGKEKWIEVSASPITDENGEITRVLYAAMDITERRQAEAELQKRTHDLGERVKEQTCLYGISGLAGKQGISLEEIAQGAVDFIPPGWQYPEITCARLILGGQEFRTRNFRETGWKQAQDIMADGERMGTVEVCYLEERPEIDEGPFLGEEGNLIKAIAQQLGTITGRKRMEEELRESEEKYRNLVNNSNDIVCTADESGNWTFLSPSVETILGYNPAEMVGRPAFDFMFPEDSASTREAHESVVREGSLFREYENRWISKDGGIVTLAWNVVALQDERGNIIGTQAVGRDITERKRMEQQLKGYMEKLEQMVEGRTQDLKDAQAKLAESEERYRALFEHAGDAIVVYDRNWVIRGWNRRAEEMFGHRADEVVGRTWESLNPPAESALGREARRQAEELGAEAGKQGFYHGREMVVYMTKDGRPLPVEASGAQIRDKAGKLTGFSAIFRDIGERKRLERELADSEEKYRTIFEHAGDAVVVYDANWVIRGWNRRAEEMFGHRADEVVGRTWESLNPPAESALGREARRQAEELGAEVEGQGFYRSQELVTYITKGYRPLPVETTGAIVRDSKGKPALFVAISRDISERKRLEKELADSEQKYRSLFEHAGDAIVVYDTKGVVREWNRRAEEMFGHRADEVVGRPWQALVPPTPAAARKARRRFERLAAEVEKQGFYQGREMVAYMRKDGRPLPVEASGAVVRDEGGKLVGFEAIFRDTSERKRLERERERYARNLEAKIEEVERTRGELEEAQEQLVASERMAAIGKLASMVGHELRNPLGVIGNSAYYLKMKLGDGGEKVKSHLDILERQVAICSKIISELLDFGRPAKPAVGEADINSIVEQTLSCCQVPSNVELVTELGEGLPKVMADKDQMQQVFHNLLVNAAQAMPQGGRLTVRTAHRDNVVQAEFADTGIGIPGDNLARIFQPLFSTKAKGTGLGLAVTESILDRHGGTIEVESEEGKGTTFTVSLPVLQAGEAKP